MGRRVWVMLAGLIVAGLMAVFAVGAEASSATEDKLTAFDGGAGDRYGSDVGVSNSGSVVVGAAGDDDNGSGSGSVYLYVPDGLGGYSDTKLTPSDGEPGDAFGISVRVSGAGTVVVGATGDDDLGSSAGAAYVFVPDGAGGYSETKLTASDGVSSDDFGRSVGIASSGVVVVGASGDDDLGSSAGAAYVFVPDGAGGYSETKLTASDGVFDDRFGGSVAIADSGTIVVGATGHIDRGLGAAYVFVPDGAGGYSETKLDYPEGRRGDEFGREVAVSQAGTVVVGAVEFGGPGAAYVFAPDGAGGYSATKLTASDGQSYDVFGGSSVGVAENGRIVVGASGDDDLGSSAGAAYVFVPDGAGGYLETKVTADDGASGDRFGTSVGISDSGTIVVGASRDDDKGTDSGSAHLLGVTGGSVLGSASCNSGLGDVNGDCEVRWAVLGDSYISGEGLTDNGSYDAGTNTKSNNCHRAQTSWAVELAKGLGASGPDLLFAACSGAVAVEVTTVAQWPGSPYEVHGGLPQAVVLADFVRDGGPVDGVFVSIGGNDAGFSSQIMNCLKPFPECYPNLESTLQGGATNNEVFRNVRDALWRIRQEAPGARVMIAGYPNPVSPAQVPFCGLFGDNVKGTEQDNIGSYLGLINRSVEAAADETGVEYLDQAGVFEGTGACSGSQPENVNALALGFDRFAGFNPFAGLVSALIAQESFHPTDEGHDVMRAWLEPLVEDSLNGPAPSATGSPPPGPVWAQPPFRFSIAQFADEVADDSLLPFSSGEDLLVDFGVNSVPTSLGQIQVEAGAEYGAALDPPAELGPGLHTLEARNAATGEVIDSVIFVVEDRTDCAATAGPGDGDGDGNPDDCDSDPLDGPLADFDVDGVLNEFDNCLAAPNPDQADVNENEIGDVCDPALGGDWDAGFRTHDGLTTQRLCLGEQVTVDLNNGDTPTSGDDVILGTENADLIDALAGDDLVCGGRGDDVIDGGPGDDRIDGNDGDDTLNGGPGDDTILGGPDNDIIDGGPDVDQLDGGPGVNTITDQPGGLVFTPVNPCTFGTADALAGGSVTTFQLAGADLPDSQGTDATNCGVPEGAVAAAVNVTAIDPLRSGNFRLSASGVVPSGGVVNFAATSPGLFNANAVVVDLSASGAVDVGVNCGSGCVAETTGVRLTVSGFYTEPAGFGSGLGYTPVTPCAVFDSRPSQGGAGLFDTGEARSYQIAGSFPANQGGGNTDCDIPADAEAVMINLVAVNSAYPGAFAVGPNASSLGEAVVSHAPLSPAMNNSNAVIVPLAGDGTLDVRAFGPAATDAVANARGVVLGYLSPADETTLALHSVTPCAAFDSRTNQGPGIDFAGSYDGGETRTFQIAGGFDPAQGGGNSDCGVPDGATAVLVNLVAVNPFAAGNLRIAATGTVPTGGVLNYAPLLPGMNNSNAVIVPLDALGRLDVTANGGPGRAGVPSTDVRGVILAYLN